MRHEGRGQDVHAHLAGDQLRHDFTFGDGIGFVTRMRGGEKPEKKGKEPTTGNKNNGGGRIKEGSKRNQDETGKKWQGKEREGKRVKRVSEQKSDEKRDRGKK